MVSTSVRLVALDLDGTLVGEDLLLHPRVREAVTRTRERGIAVVIVTGRMFAAARPFAQQLGISGPIVCYQGAAIFDVQSTAQLTCTPVRPDVTRDVLAWARRTGVHAQCYQDDVLYVDEINRFSRRYTELARVEAVLVTSLEDRFAQQPTVKIVLVDDPERSAAHLEALRPLLAHRAYLTRSHVDFVEILDPTVNKGAALRWIAARSGVPMESTLAVGDAWNDTPMLEAAGFAVAMGSAPAELRAQADAVVADAAGAGVAEALERFVLA